MSLQNEKGWHKGIIVFGGDISATDTLLAIKKWECTRPLIETFEEVSIMILGTTVYVVGYGEGFDEPTDGVYHMYDLRFSINQNRDKLTSCEFVLIK